MVDDTFKRNALPEEFAEDVVRILRVQGPVFEAQLGASSGLLAMESFRAAGKTGDAPVVSVVQRLGDGRIRCAGSGPVAGLRRDDRLKLEPSDDVAPLSEERLKEVVQSIHRSAAVPPEVRETGIKAVDLFCPLPARSPCFLLSSSATGR